MLFTEKLPVCHFISNCQPVRPLNSAVSEGRIPSSGWVWKLPDPCCDSQRVIHTNGASPREGEDGENWNQKSEYFLCPGRGYSDENPFRQQIH